MGAANFSGVLIGTKSLFVSAPFDAGLNVMPPMSVQDSPQSSDSYMSVRSMIYWAIRLQSVLGSVCVMSRVGFHSVSLVLLISCLHALAGVRQPILREL